MIYYLNQFLYLKENNTSEYWINLMNLTRNPNSPATVMHPVFHQIDPIEWDKTIAIAKTYQK